MGITYLDTPKSKITYIDEKQPVGLPQLSKVEKTISEREDGLKSFMKDVAKKPKNYLEAIQHPIINPMLGAARGAMGALQRLESGVANYGLAVQRGEPDTNVRAKEFIKGLTGEKQGQLGDIVRTTGFGGIANEPIAATTGLLGASALTGGLQYGKNIGKPVTTETVKESMPRIMNKKWFMEKVQQLNTTVDDTLKSVKSEYDTFYNSPIGESPVDYNKVNGAVNNLWGAAKAEAQGLIDDINKEFPEGQIQPTVKDAKKLKDLVQNYLPENVWLKGKKGANLTPNQQKMVNTYFQLKEVIKEGLKDTEEGKYLSYLDQKATDVYRTGKAIKRMIIDETGRPVKTQNMISAFSGKPASYGKRDLFDRLSQLNNEAQKTITDMQKFHRRQSLKTTAKVVGGLGLGGYLLKRGIGNVVLNATNQK